MALRLDVVTDTRTDKLLRICKGVRLAGLVPAESGKNLVALSTAVREFALACEPAMALSVLDEIVKLVADVDDPTFTKMFDGATTLVRKALTPTKRN